MTEQPEVSWPVRPAPPADPPPPESPPSTAESRAPEAASVDAPAPLSSPPSTAEPRAMEGAPVDAPVSLPAPPPSVVEARDPEAPPTEAVAPPPPPAAPGTATTPAADPPVETVATPVVGGMTEAELRAALEAILMVADEPISETALAQALDEPEDRVAATLAALAAEYTAQGRGFDLRQVAGGWRYYTRAEQAAYVERFVLDGQQARLSQAALETLAVIAYRQPVTRARVAAVRGVNCDGVIRTLLTRGLIEEAGTEPESGAYLYRTTSVFLEKLGLNSLDELPPLAPFLPDDLTDLDPDTPPERVTDAD